MTLPEIKLTAEEAAKERARLELEYEYTEPGTPEHMRASIELFFAPFEVQHPILAELIRRH